MEIKAITGAVIYESETAKNKRDLIEEALMRGADLSDADLRRADLSGADLRRANLSGANLSDAELRGADLRRADFSGAELSDAELSDADLYGANLRGADLRRADFSGADLSDANFSDANLSGANLRGANLRGAELSDADLRRADLSGADLIGAINIPYVPLACPSDGEFTGWKKVNGKLVQILIPADAKRSSATTAKCRCEKAKVLSIISIEEDVTYTEVTNYNYEKLTYKVGEMVFPDSFDDNRWNECSHGIHFFINKQDAINY